MVFNNNDIFKTLIEISGKDSKTFLQGQLTNDIALATENNSSISSLCTNQGKVLSVFRISKFNDSYLLETPTEIANNIINKLKIFTLNSDVKIQISKSLKLISIQSDELNKTIKTPRNYLEIINIDNLQIIKISQTKNRFNIIGKIQDIQNLTTKLQLTNADNNEYQLLDIKDEFVNITCNTYDKFTPYALNLDKQQAINFKKGCYVGQEIIARVKYLGAVKKRLYQAQVITKNNIETGDKLLCEKNTSKQGAGTIISIAQNHKQENLCQLLINIDENIKNQMITTTDNDKISIL
ncbi:MAG: hypothetical protein DRQ51_07955 [Gammaproteobacteria bacterium]|nr:MAG: hypothetical protein DRQ51_07955 [Gammaproteobacteria bacterium]